jgi:hypothetical protein
MTDDVDEAYRRGREEVFDLLQNEALYPRRRFDREEWKELINDLVTSMRSNELRGD